MRRRRRTRDTSPTVQPSDTTLPIHPRQRERERLQRSQSKREGTTMTKVEIVEDTARSDSAASASDDALDEGAVEAKTDHERADGSQHWSPQVWDCAVNGNLQGLLVLAARGQLVDVPHPTTGITPLWAAAESGHSAVVQFLLETMGVRVNTRAVDGSTPLFAAASMGHAAVVAALLDEASVDVDLPRVADLATPLYVACQRGFVDVAQLLLECGANPNVQRRGGYSCLWTACNRGHGALVEVLVGRAVNLASGDDDHDMIPDFALANEAGVRPATAAKRAGYPQLAALVERTAKHQAETAKRAKLDAKAQEAAKTPAAIASAETSMTGTAGNKEEERPKPPPSPMSPSRKKASVTRKDSPSGIDEGIGSANQSGVDKSMTTAEAVLNAKSPDTSRTSASLESISSTCSTSTSTSTSTSSSGSEAVDQASKDNNNNNDDDGDDNDEEGLPIGQLIESPEEAVAATVPATTLRLRPEDSIFVYSKQEERSWEWEWYIRQSRLFTHDICRCARDGNEDDDDDTSGSSAQSSSRKPPPPIADGSSSIHPCKWWRLQPKLFELEPCVVSTALFEQVAQLHRLAAERQGLFASAASSSADKKKMKNSGGLRITQCLFTESRGASAGSLRCHTLELRIAAPRPKRAKQARLAFTDPRLVRRDEVVLLLGLPLRFPADTRVRVHCMQNRERIPPQVLATPALSSPRAGGSDALVTSSTPQEEEEVLPGALLPLTSLSHGWPPHFSLASFTGDFLQRIEALSAEGDPNCGLLPVPPYRLYTEAADAILERNSASSLFESKFNRHVIVCGCLLICAAPFVLILTMRYGVHSSSYLHPFMIFVLPVFTSSPVIASEAAEAARKAKHDAPLTPEAKKARWLVFFGVLVQVGAVFLLLYLKQHGI